jgi:hypothetical protein
MAQLKLACQAGGRATIVLPRRERQCIAEMEKIWGIILELVDWVTPFWSGEDAFNGTPQVLDSGAGSAWKADESPSCGLPQVRAK